MDRCEYNIIYVVSNKTRETNKSTYIVNWFLGDIIEVLIREQILR